MCICLYRSSHPEVFCKKDVLKNLTEFTGKHLCQSLFFNKVAGLKLATLLKKRLWQRYFPVNFVKFLRKPISTENLWWLLLSLKLQNNYSSKLSKITVMSLAISAVFLFLFPVWNTFLREKAGSQEQSSLLMCPFLLMSPLNVLYLKEVTNNVHENQQAKSRAS